jgi:hypothetical protein
MEVVILDCCLRWADTSSLEGFQFRALPVLTANGIGVYEATSVSHMASSCAVSTGFVCILATGHALTLVTMMLCLVYGTVVIHELKDVK